MRSTWVTILALVACPAGAGAHAGNNSATVVHACVNNLTKMVRIVGVTGVCMTVGMMAETAQHWDIVGPRGPQGAPGPSGITHAVAVNTPGSVIPFNFQVPQMVPSASTVVDVAAGQRILVYADLELEPTFNDAQDVYEVILTIGYRRTELGLGAVVTTLPVQRPIGLPGRHNRLQSVHGLIVDLAPGTYEVGVAGVSQPPAPGEFVTVNHVRSSVLVLDP